MVSISSLLLLLWTTSSSWSPSDGFQSQPRAGPPHHRVASLRSTEQSSADDSQALLTVKNHLKKNYPAMSLILEKNDSVWKALAGAEEGGFTIFAPNQGAMEALGEAKQGQLLDVRNLETTQKVGAYHVIAEKVSAEALFNAGGVVTLGGEVAVERSRTGGMFGVGGKEDGKVTVGGSRVVQSVDLGSGVLHETDGLISPSVMWRYMDQLRIPGSN